jgi:hypothetical protein
MPIVARASPGKILDRAVVELAHNVRFAAHELNIIRKLVEEHREYLIEQWHERFDQ